MAPRNPRLEQAVPKEDTPEKAWERKRSPPKRFQKSSKEPAVQLPKGKIAQNRAKPGMTSPQ